MSNPIGKLVALLLVLVFGGGVYLAMRERPVLVDTAEIVRAPMEITIEEEGETRVRDVYTVSSPIAGHLDRTTLDEGQRVMANETVIASIHPLEPPFLDERTMAELRAAVEAAKAGVSLAEVEHTQAKVAFDLAKSEYERAAKLAKTNIISESQIERSYNELQLKEAQVKRADSMISLRKAELASALARLQQPSEISATTNKEACCIQLTAPVDGIVLKVLARSEQAVTPGTPITEVGDPSDLEIIIDLLSTDAPKIAIGSPVIISHWGGEEDIAGTVRRIDPTAFRKTSSLGIEEQRVNAIIDISDIPPALGHGYRVVGNIVIWSEEDVLQIPIGALFRSGGDWATFVLEDGRARLQRLTLGRMNAQTAQIQSGLEAGDFVILFPSDVLEDGSLVEARK